MKTLPMPDIESDEDADEFYNGGDVAILGTRNVYSALESLDELLANYGLEIGLYDTGSSDYAVTILEREQEPKVDRSGSFIVMIDGPRNRIIDAIHDAIAIYPKNRKAPGSILLYWSQDVERDRLTVKGIPGVTIAEAEISHR
jgi:hypothetical protein